METFRNHNLYYDVEITTEQQRPLVGFPWIKPSNFIKALGKHSDLGMLLGGRRTLVEAKGMLDLFWQRYQDLFPQHQLFADVQAGKKELSKCIPIFVHGDEGVHYKKSGVLVLSIQGVVGTGSKKRSPTEVAKNQYPSELHELPLNFLRPGTETRLLSIVCPKVCVGENLLFFSVFLTFFNFQSYKGEVFQTNISCRSDSQSCFFDSRLYTPISHPKLYCPSAKKFLY